MVKIWSISVAFLENIKFNGKHGQGTDSTEMGADKLTEKTMPKNLLPKLSAQAQKFGILMKKASLGVHSPCIALV